MQGKKNQMIYAAVVMILVINELVQLGVGVFFGVRLAMYATGSF